MGDVLFLGALLNLAMSHTIIIHCRKKHGLDMASKEARELELMHLVSGDFALEQPRPLPPKVKLVGALMPAPAKPLPADLEVSEERVTRSLSHDALSLRKLCDP